MMTMHPVTFDYIVFTIQNFLSHLLPHLPSKSTDFSAFLSDEDQDENESVEVSKLLSRR